MVVASGQLESVAALNGTHSIAKRRWIHATTESGTFKSYFILNPTTTSAEFGSSQRQPVTVNTPEQFIFTGTPTNGTSLETELEDYVAGCSSVKLEKGMHRSFTPRMLQ